MREQTLAWSGVTDEIAWGLGDRHRVPGPLRPAGVADVAYLLPHGTIRLLVIGTGDRQPNPEELDRMREHVRQGMAEGAVGLSTGLSYPPAMFADTEELVALCEEVAPFGGFFAPHHRSYGKGALEADAEMIEVARRSGVPLHLTHCVMNFPGNEGRARADPPTGGAGPRGDRGDGRCVPVYCRVHLSRLTASTLDLGEGHGGDAGGPRGRRPGPAGQAREMEEGTAGYHFLPIAWDTVEISAVGTEANQRWVGKRLPEIAAAQSVTPFEAARRLLLQERLNVNVLLHVGFEANLREVIRQPYHMGGTDGILTGAKPHPRGYGTFPRFLGKYARDEGMFRVEEIVRKLTSLPQRRLGQWDRGPRAAGSVGGSGRVRSRERAGHRDL